MFLFASVLGRFRENIVKTEYFTCSNFTPHAMRALFVYCCSLLLLSFVPFGAQAQKAAIQKKASGRTTTTSVTPQRQGLVMRNGKLMEIQGKGYAPVTNARTFANGAKLQPSGALTMPNGETIQLQEGDHLDLKGTLTRSPVEVQKSTTVSGDTTGISQQLLQAQQINERLKLLQEKQRVLERKNELLQKTAQNKPAAADLKKLDAEIFKLQQQLEAQNQRKQ
jgi:hypothetical protein